MRDDKAIKKILDDQQKLGTRPIPVMRIHPTRAGKWIAIYDGEGNRTVGLVVEARTQQAPNGIAMLVIERNGRGGKATIHRISRQGHEQFFTAKADELESNHRKAIRSMAAGLAAKPAEPGAAPERKGDYDYFKSPAADDLKTWVGTEVTAWPSFEGFPGLLTEVTGTHAVIYQPYWKANRVVPLKGTTFQRVVQTETVAADVPQQ
ncbi:hypothetical protein [Saccharothrix sp. ST-888]|uniref:hypothetical protein n=1 Tax=Saccharothrix sp. ST-888 TaxID=1427391 RepID=UPI0005EBFD15|nr:hypothetical protein [Saccharothrix sp. ST-888]KJK56108.1 hypothetical protein UK12_24520 [Saccharothrix sp. ST-888]